ncbi:TadE/TadG family type IV pilus assembly protein [Ferrovum myxofaciens]|uniref:TadE/TadG family type IV pilus assembly protein n=1 Tax=Ferrovum myxofaciens TaxID=416213 RepID=UPI00235800AF|nr:TadE/TadG family type IV pilus assembly protein [Ferrovum myxofaciens]MBU6995501.1 pilus assembly protein [Ferrovum myxofaciens]
MSSERGVAAVEFALIFPLMLLLMFGIIEFSTMMYDQIMVTNAAREGARWGSAQSVSLAHPISCSDVSGIQGGPTCSGSGSGSNACMVASNYAANTLISYQGGSNNSPLVTVHCNPNPQSGACNPNQNQNQSCAAIEVTVQYTFQGLGLGSLSAVQGSNNLSSKAVMYYE